MPLFGRPPNIKELKARHDVRRLIKALHTSDGAVREQAIEALGDLGEPQAVQPLWAAYTAALKGQRWGESAVAREAFIRLGRPAVDLLIAALKDKDRSVRRTVPPYMLGDAGDVRAVEPLIAALKDLDSEMRQAAAEALGKLGDQRAVEPLIVALHDTDAQVRNKAAAALGQLGDAAVEPLIATLQDKNFAVQTDAALALTIAVRETAAEVLGKLGDQRAVEPLIAALHDEYFPVQANAAGALGKLKDPRAVEPLIAALHDKNFAIQTSAAEVLGKLGDQRAVEPLIVALQDKSSFVRREAAEALGKLKDPRAVEPLSTALKDGEESVRVAILRALEDLHALWDAQTVYALIATVNDGPAQEAGIARRLLKEYPSPEGDQALAEHDRREEEAEAASLRQLSDRSTEDLIEELVRIGRLTRSDGSGGYLPRNETPNAKRTWEIGTILDQRGGISLMRSAHARVRILLGGVRARELEVSWSGIGRWLG